MNGKSSSSSYLYLQQGCQRLRGVPAAFHVSVVIVHLAIICAVSSLYMFWPGFHSVEVMFQKVKLKFPDTVM